MRILLLRLRLGLGSQLGIIFTVEEIQSILDVGTERALDYLFHLYLFLDHGHLAIRLLLFGQATFVYVGHVLLIAIIVILNIIVG